MANNTNMPDGVTIKTSQNNSISEEQAIFALTKSASSLNNATKELNTSIQAKKKQDEEIIKEAKKKKKGNTVKDNKQKKKKEDEEENNTRKIFIEGFENTTKSLQTNWGSFKANVSEAISTPFKLYTEPLKQILGVDLFSVFGAVIEDSKKKGKKNPSASDVAKTGSQGTNTLYITDTLKEIFGDKDKKKDGGKVLGLLGTGGISNMVTKFLSGAGLTLGIGGVIVGLTMGIMDGIKGFFKSEEWGIPKALSTLSAVLAGTKGELKGALLNSLKAFLLGAGPNWVIGGLLGFFGGENIGNLINDLIWTPLKDTFTNILTEYSNIWKDSSSGIVKKIFKSAVKFIFTVFEFSFDLIKNFFINPKFKKAMNSLFIKTLKFDKMGNWIKDTFSNILDGIKNLFTKIGSFFNESITSIIDKVTPSFLKRDSGKKGLLESLLGKKTKVNDAIITKTGKVIETSPDDNIIATKNNPANISTNNGKGDVLLASVLNKISKLLEEIKAQGISNATIINHKPLLDMVDLKGF